MQDLLIRLLCDDSEISGKVNELSRAMPGYQEMLEEFRAAEAEARAVLGRELYERYSGAVALLNCYENRAYYALGLGLREALIRSLVL